jgi:hypothetical protein
VSKQAAHEFARAYARFHRATPHGAPLLLRLRPAPGLPSHHPAGDERVHPEAAAGRASHHLRHGREAAGFRVRGRREPVPPPVHDGRPDRRAGVQRGQRPELVGAGDLRRGPGPAGQRAGAASTRRTCRARRRRRWPTSARPGRWAGSRRWSWARGGRRSIRYIRDEVLGRGYRCRVKLKALVLAAGRSTRIEPVSGGRPKPLLEVGGRSLLEWNLRWLTDAGIGPVWVNLHYRGDEVRSAVEAMALPGEPSVSLTRTRSWAPPAPGGSWPASGTGPAWWSTATT